MFSKNPFNRPWYDVLLTSVEQYGGNDLNCLMLKYQLLAGEICVTLCRDGELIALDTLLLCLHSLKKYCNQMSLRFYR